MGVEQVIVAKLNIEEVLSISIEDVHAALGSDPAINIDEAVGEIDYVADLEDRLVSTTSLTNFVSQCSYDNRFDSCQYNGKISHCAFNDNRYFPDQTFEKCRANEVCLLFLALHSKKK